MKALVKAKAERGLWMQDVPVPAIGINDVLIRVHKTGICGTDLHIYKWDAWAQKTIPVPMVVGHEFVGEIVETGSNVNDFRVGDIVSAEGHVVCGRCRNCLAGRRHLCADTKGIGVNRPGAFAEFISVPMTNVWHHKPDIDRDVASIFDPFGKAYHYSSDKYCRIRTLSPLNLEKDVELYEVRLQPGGALRSAPHFEGTREFLTVEQGEVRVECGKDSELLKPGDSANYRADQDHAIVNAGTEQAVVLLVVIYR